MTFINVSQPTIATGIELVDRTIDRSIDLIDQIKQEQLSARSNITTPVARTESNNSNTEPSSSSTKEFDDVLKFESIDPQAIMANLVTKAGKSHDFNTVVTKREIETHKISGQEYFSETRHVSSSDDDSLVIKIETKHELIGHEHQVKEKTIICKEGDHTKTSQKKIEKSQHASDKRCDVENRAVIKSTDDTELVLVHREFAEQGLYTGRQTKSEEKMTAVKDETVKKTNEVKYSERDLSHEQWGKEYFSEPSELQDIEEDDDSSRVKEVYVHSSLKIRDKDETVSTSELSEKGKVVSATSEHYREESVIESNDHDEASSADISHNASFRSENADRRDSSELSPRSKSKSFKKDDEVYEVNFIKEIKVSASPDPKSISRTGSQDSDLEAGTDLPHDDRSPKDSPIRFDRVKQPVKLPHQEIEGQVWEVSFQKTESFEITEDMPSFSQPTRFEMKSALTKSSDSDTIIDDKTVREVNAKPKPDVLSPMTADASDEISTTSKDVMIKSGGSVDTEYMVKSLESHEGEVLQKSIDSTVSAETLQHSEFSTDADSAFLTGTDHKKDELKLVKEKSLEDICSSGYDTDLSSAEFQGMKLDGERVEAEIKSVKQPLTDLSVLEKTIDEVKQSLEAAQVEIISEKSDGSSKYKQSPSEFEFRLMSPDKHEVIAEEPAQEEDTKKSAVSVSEQDTQKSDDSRKLSSREVTSDKERDTVQEKETISGPDITEYSGKSDSGPHSILETESEVTVSDKDESSKGSPEVKMRINNKHLRTKLGVADRRSASDIEGYSSSGESHYQSFEHSDSAHSRPLSSDVENLTTAHSTADFETACTNQDGSSRSMRSSKEYYTAVSSITSRESLKSLDSEASSHLASIDISDASETLVPSANELKEELMESGNFTDHFMPESSNQKPKDVEIITKEDEVTDEVFEYYEDRKSMEIEEPVSKMKRSHEMRFLPKEMIPEHFPLETIEGSIDNDPEKHEILRTSPIIEENIFKGTKTDLKVIPFQVSLRPEKQREFVDVESEIIEFGTKEYEEIKNLSSKLSVPLQDEDTTEISEHEVCETLPKLNEIKELQETCLKKSNAELKSKPFPISQIPASQREFSDIESDIIAAGTDEYEELFKTSSNIFVTKESEKDNTNERTTLEYYPTDTKESSTTSLKSECTEAYPIESKQSSGSSLRSGAQEFLSTPHTPLSAPSQSSESTENGKEYVLDDMFEISETPDLKSDQLVSERSSTLITTEEPTLYEATGSSGFRKDPDSPTSDEFEMIEKPNEMDDFVVIEEVAKEASESDQEGKSLQIKQQKFIKKHDEEVEELLFKASKKQEVAYSTSSSLSDEEMQAYELEQKRLKSQEQAEVEAGKKWMQMQFEGDPRYDYERVPLEDIKEEEMTDFDASRIGSLSSQKESVGSCGSFRNSYGSLSESEMMSRRRFMVRGEQDDVSISSLQEFENLEKALMDQYQHTSSSSQDSLNGSLPRRYKLSKSAGDDMSVSSLKEFEGLESECIEALKVEIQAKQKEALLLSQDPKVASGGFLEHEKRSYSGSSESSPPQKSGSPGQKSGSPSQKEGSPYQKSDSPGQRLGSTSQKQLTDSLSIRKLIDQTLSVDLNETSAPTEGSSVVLVKKYDERGAFFVPSKAIALATKTSEISEDCWKKSAYSCIAQKDIAESMPGDCEEMMKLLDQEGDSNKTAITRTITDGGVVEVVRTTKVIQQRFVDGKNVSETVTEGGVGVDIPGISQVEYDGSGSIKSFDLDMGRSDVSSSATSQQSDVDSLITIMERPFLVTDSTSSTVTVATTSRNSMSIEKPDELDLSRSSEFMMRELSPSSGRSVSHTITSVSGKHFTDPASGSWSGQDEDMSSSGSLSRARADLMLGSTDSLEATSSNATRATFNYEVDTPMTGSLTSGGSNTMVSSLDTLDPVTAMHLESTEHTTAEPHQHEQDVQEPDSDTERLELDGQAPRAKERTIMFDSTDTLSAVSGDGSGREGAVETPAPTFFIGDTPIQRGEREEREPEPPLLSGSCPASLPPPPEQPPAPVPAQRRSITMISKSSTSQEEMTKK